MKVKKFLRNPYNFILANMFIFFAFAFIVDTPRDIWDGLIRIVLSQDVLITDYFYIGGVGATLVNAGLTGVIAVTLFKIFKVQPSGMGILAVWMIPGYAFFGKNIANIWPIILGGYLYSLYQRKPYRDFIIVIFLSTTLAPAITQVTFFSESTIIGVIFALILGILIGFIIHPLSMFTLRAHARYNLYNVGFSAGLVSLFLAAIFRNRGHDIGPLARWSTEYNTISLIFILTLCLVSIIGGLWLSYDKSFLKEFSIKEYIKDCKLIEDKYMKYGPRTYINTGVIGIIGVAAVYALGGQLNGPILGGVFTIIAFACLGKNPYNMLPLMIGLNLAVLIHGWDLSDNRTVMATTLVTSLAPIPSRLGPIWGVAAGMLHLNIIVQLAQMNAGLSLYNNGLAAGLVAIVIVPIVFAIRRKGEVT